MYPKERRGLAGFLTSQETGLGDYVTSQESGLGVLPVAAVSVVSKALPGLFKSGSPRYMGGPLVTTVQQILTAIAGGSTGDVQRLYQIAHNPTEKDRTAWLSVWNDLLPTIRVSSSVLAAIQQLDPTVASRMSTGAGPTSVTVPAGQTTVEKIVSAVRELPVVQAVETEYVNQAVQQKAGQAATVGKSVLPYILGGGVLYFLTRGRGRRRR